MSVTINGGHARGYLSRAPGTVGAKNVGPIGIGWDSITASATNDTVVVGIGGLLQSESLAQGVFFQCEVACTITFTLADPGLATSKDPNQNGLVPFGNSLSVTANTIVKAPVLFTAFKVVFAAAGTLYVGVR